MQSLETKPLLLDVHSITLRVTHEEFEKLCQDNPDRSFELTATGELIVMASVLQEKMEEYRSNGVRLGLLINLKNKQVEIYRSGQEPEILESPTEIDCSEVMPGSILSMSEIW
jgi:Uma2 family endonuclease